MNVNDFKAVIKAKKEQAESSSTQFHPVPPSSTQLHPVPPKEDYFLKDVLESDKPTFKQLKNGIHNNTYYFGTVLYKGSTPIQAVVTSEKKVHFKLNKEANAIRNDYQLFYRYDFQDDILDGSWSQKGIKEYIYRDVCYTLKEVYNSLYNKNKEYMDYFDPMTHSIVALDIMATYYLPCFQAMGRTALESEKGSGKTRQCTVYKYASCNSLMSNDITKAAFFRAVESTVTTLIIDDFDNLGDDQKRDVLQHYITGYKDSGKSIRTGDERDRRLHGFKNYGHVVINNTTGLSKIAADRSKYLVISKSSSPVTKRNLNECDLYWEEIRDKQYALAMQSWLRVKESYDTVKSSFYGREFEIARPLLALANLISVELKESVETWFKDQFARSKVEDVSNDWKYLAFTELAKYEEGDSVRLSLITDSLVSATVEDSDPRKKSKERGISTYLGKMLRQYGFLKFVKLQGLTAVKVLSKAKLRDYMTQQGWNEEPKTLEVEEEVVV